MKKLVGVIILIAIFLIGCSEDEKEKLIFTSVSSNWQSDIQMELGKVNTDEEEKTELTVKYTGENLDELENTTITIALMEPEGGMSQDFNGLPSSGILKMNLSDSNVYGKLKTYDRLEIQIRWKENGEDVIESLYFTY